MPENIHVPVTGFDGELIFGCKWVQQIHTSHVLVVGANNVRPLNFSVGSGGFVPALNLLHRFRSSKGWHVTSVTVLLSCHSTAQMLWFPPLPLRFLSPFSSSSCRLQGYSWVGAPAWLFPRNEFLDQGASLIMEHRGSSCLHKFCSSDLLEVWKQESSEMFSRQTILSSHCKLLWTKASAKCPKCTYKIKYNRLIFRMAKGNIVILQQGVLQGKIDSQDHVITWSCKFSCLLGKYWISIRPIFNDCVSLYIRLTIPFLILSIFRQRSNFTLKWWRK